MLHIEIPIIPNSMPQPIFAAIGPMTIALYWNVPEVNHKSDPVRSNL